MSCRQHKLNNIIVAHKNLKQSELGHKTTFAEISCGIPPNGVETEIPIHNLTYPDTYNYSCLTGYETNDDITTECLSNGSLSLDSPPNCTSE